MTRLLPLNPIASRLLGSLLVAAALGGCAELAPMFERKPERDHDRAASREAARADKSPPVRSEPRTEAQPGRDQVALREGIRLYNEGNFNGAIKRLSSTDIRNGSPLRTRVTALKYTAFSYCVTSRPKQCEQAFERALKLDPDFELEPGEQGHPLWGPAFARAKKG